MTAFVIFAPWCVHLCFVRHRPAKEQRRDLEGNRTAKRNLVKLRTKTISRGQMAGSSHWARVRWTFSAEIFPLPASAAPSSSLYLGSPTGSTRCRPRTSLKPTPSHSMGLKGGNKQLSYQVQLHRCTSFYHALSTYSLKAAILPPLYVQA